MTTVSVVFPVHDNKDVARVSLPAIARQMLPAPLSHEVVVVDDGSRPETADWLRAHCFPPCRLIRHERNLGRSAARNTGVRESNGTVVIFLDSDVIVRPDFVARHTEALGPGTAAAGGRPRLSLGRVIDVSSLSVPPETTRIPSGLPGFTTANVALLRDLLIRVQETPDGPFDQRRFTAYGWEDLELEQRLLQLAPKRIRNAAAAGFHYCPPFRTEQLAALLRKEIERAAMAHVFLAKHPHWEVRLMTQMTPLHRVLWEILSVGGLLNEKSLRPFLSWLTAHGQDGLAATIARIAILNPAYIRHL